MVVQDKALSALPASAIVGAWTRQSGTQVRVAPAEPEVGEVVDERFHITSLLADGGMGRVVQAVDLQTGREVALKYVRREVADDVAASRLALEAKVLDRLRHPNVVEFIHSGELADGGPYYVMERVRGAELVDVLYGRTISIPRALGILRQLAAVLDHAHGNGIVHRDLKPENVIVVDRGGADLVKVLDFGIARSLAPSDPKLTQKGMVLGTPTYMSPEQALGIAVAPASDRYSLAVMAFEMLTGSLPRAERRSPILMVEAIVRTAPLAPSAVGLEVEGLDAIFAQALAARPEQRFTDAASFVDALEECLASRMFCEDDVRDPSYAPRATPTRDSLELVFSDAVDPSLEVDPRAGTLAFLRPAASCAASHETPPEKKPEPIGDESREPEVEDPREETPLDAPPQSDEEPIREPERPEKVEDPPAPGRRRGTGQRLLRPRGEFPVVPKSPRRVNVIALSLAGALALGAVATLVPWGWLADASQRAVVQATSHFATP